MHTRAAPERRRRRKRAASVSTAAAAAVRLHRFALALVCLCMWPTAPTAVPGRRGASMTFAAAAAARAAHSSRVTADTDAEAAAPGVLPREHYLGAYGERCQRAPAPDDSSAARRLPCFTGRGVRVAVLDTGLCAGFAEHSRNSVTCTSVVPGVACADAGCAHGTRVASVLAGHVVAPSVHSASGNATGSGPQQRDRTTAEAAAAAYTGMAPGATVRVFRVFDTRGQTHQRYLLDALTILLREADEGALGGRRRVWNTSDADERRHRRGGGGGGEADQAVHVISLSYGGEDYLGGPPVQDALSRLMHEYGVVVVAAAGNADLRFGSVRSPADMPGVVAVGAMRLERRRAATGATTPSLHRWVSSFSGRGPTTWELPFGAGRVKPDLVALGEGVRVVHGVVPVPQSRGAAPAPTHALRLRAASGTSIATPIVAGVVALCLEAAWSSSSSSPSSSQRGPGTTVGGGGGSTRLARVHTSLRVRAALARTALPLSLPTSDATWTSPPNDSTGATPRRVLAGVPLLELYARYLHLSRLSILAQGAGELQPLRALHAILASRPSGPPGSAPCSSFAVPPSVRIGAGEPHRPSRPHGGPGEAARDDRHMPDAYWWPLSDLLLYAGAAPVLLNISLHLCPASPPPRVTYAIEAVRGYTDTPHSATPTHDAVEGSAVAVLHTAGHDDVAAAAERLLRRHLLRVEAELTEAKVMSPPATSFSLSVGLSCPLSALSHLCHDAQTTTVAARGGGGGGGGGDAVGCTPLFRHFLSVVVDAVLRVAGAGQHPPLEVPLSVRIVRPPPRAQRVLIDTSLDWPNPTAAASDVFVAGDDPHEAPPPTGEASGGGGGGGGADGVGGAPPRVQRRRHRTRAYAEASGGDHPQTNAALLWLYLRHTLGMAVESFPLLHAGTTTNAAAAASAADRRDARRAAGDALARVGTLLLIDPERPLTGDMRRLLTRAVVVGVGDGPHRTAGLSVVLVSDWHSAEVAAKLQWTRDDVSAHGGAEAAAVRRLRAWVSHTNGSARGVAGSFHAPSWNRWLAELTTAAATAAAVGAAAPDRNCSSSGPCDAECDGAAAAAAAAVAPFELSESIVLDGVLVVSAGADDAPTTTALRSLGQLNAAGVLQWRSPAHTTDSGGDGAPRHDTHASPAGEAVLCNVMQTWAAQQRRLTKRTSPSSSAADAVERASPSTALVEDVWESLPAPPRRRPGGGVDVSYGILGFLALPAVAAGEAAATVHGAAVPGRVAVFTDSDCLSTSDYHVQATLEELERLLYPLPSTAPRVEAAAAAAAAAVDPVCTTWTCLATTPGMQRLLQAESLQSSTCVEVLKELLLWTTHTQDLRQWRDAAQLQCETRAWADTAAQRNRSTCADSPPPQPFHDLLDTAPERVQVGEVVSRLWAALVLRADRVEAGADAADGEQDSVFNAPVGLTVRYHGSLPPSPHATRSSSSSSPRQQQQQQHHASSAWHVLQWMRHPVVLGQLSLGAALFFGVWVWQTCAGQAASAR